MKFVKRVDSNDQCTEQEPGPRGSPHVPHGPAGGWTNDLPGPLDWAANTDSSFCRSAPWQEGQLGACPSRVRNSKRLPQPRHSYSKRGITYSNAGDCGLRIEECGFRNVDSGMRIPECGLRSADCGVRIAECGVRIPGLRSDCGVPGAQPPIGVHFNLQ